MNPLTYVLSPAIGGKVRMVVTVIVAVAGVLAAMVDAVRWDAPIALSIPAVLQVLTHLTPVGNTPADAVGGAEG